MSTEVSIEANTAAKPTQHQRSETDLVVTLSGAEISLVRAYDSLDRDRSGSFGFGWRLANRDLQLEVNVPLSGREELGVHTGSCCIPQW
jgi:hypothetical protein